MTASFVQVTENDDAIRKCEGGVRWEDELRSINTVTATQCIRKRRKYPHRESKVNLLVCQPPEFVYNWPEGFQGDKINVLDFNACNFLQCGRIRKKKN